MENYDTIENKKMINIWDKKRVGLKKMKLYDVIQYRQSIRNFQMKPLEEKVLEKIICYQKTMKALYPDITCQIEIHNAMEKSWKKKKSPFQVKAPYYLSLYSSTEQGYLLNAGYVLEELSLYLNTLGIGTCYQGAMKVSDNKKSELEEVLVMALGYPSRYLYRELGTAKRIELKKECIFKEEPSKEVLTILRAANLAPSSMNNQPWKFVVYKNRIHVFSHKSNSFIPIITKLHTIDMGIMLNHMFLAAEELWLKAEFSQLDNISNQLFKDYKYIMSMLISE